MFMNVHFFIQMISIEDHNKIVEALKSEIASLSHQLDWLKRQLFASKSERFINPNDQKEFDLGITPVEVETETDCYW